MGRYNRTAGRIIVEQKKYVLASREDMSKEIFDHLEDDDIGEKLQNDDEEAKKKDEYDHQLSTAISVIRGIMTYRGKGIDG